MTHKTSIRILSLIVGMASSILLICQVGWLGFLGIFLFVYANNLERSVN